MNIDTGEVRKIELWELAGEREVIFDQPPDPKCKKCYGVGHTGRNILTGLFVPCVCTQRGGRQ